MNTSYGSEGEYLCGRQPVEQPGNGYAALRRDMDSLQRWKETVQFSGCPHHADLQKSITSSNEINEREHNEMKKVGAWMVGLQVVTLLGIAGTLAVMLWRATGHAG